jgi:hypothetical protein
MRHLPCCRRPPPLRWRRSQNFHRRPRLRATATRWSGHRCRCGSARSIYRRHRELPHEARCLDEGWPRSVPPRHDHLTLVARMERSAIRGRNRREIPGLRGACHRAALRADPVASSGLRTALKSSAENRIKNPCGSAAVTFGRQHRNTTESPVIPNRGMNPA